MIEQKLDRQTVEVDHKIDKLKRELEQSKKMAMPLDHASGRTLKVPAFDGEMSWNVYKTQFEAAATSNCWNGKERATALILALRGSAAEVLQTISAENHFNYEVLTPSTETKLPWIRLSKPFVIRNSSNPFSCQINENSRMPLRTVSLLNRQSKHQKVTYVYAKYMKNALARSLLKMALESEKSDTFQVILNSIFNNPAMADVQWNFTTKNWEQIRKKCSLLLFGCFLSAESRTITNIHNSLRFHLDSVSNS
ncbi:hypothetical protein HELRODRAFT_159686 [Helobdella robusta]|uniref:Uncharacterized protein n=1 Tax=Helobdella robusta TaxID=6412 RepID=T1EPB0_HELRO|nr:hypothetical protein HELRODRAFT_159686 [Helobdella robusta]ESO13082.1 hypothetical protein HELRODRAFT_159686 [Helobdella robusta]